MAYTIEPEPYAKTVVAAKMNSFPERSTVDGPQLDDSAKSVRPSARTRFDSVTGFCTPMETKVNSIMGSPKETRVDSVMGSPKETKVDHVATERWPKKTRFDSVTTSLSPKTPQTRTITVPITVTIPAELYYQDCKVEVTGNTRLAAASSSTDLISEVANSRSPFQVECLLRSPHRSQPQQTPSDTSQLTRTLNERINYLRLDESTAEDQTILASDSDFDIVSAMKKQRGDGKVPETQAPAGGMMTDEMASKFFDFPLYAEPSTRRHTKIYVEGSLL